MKTHSSTADSNETASSGAASHVTLVARTARMLQLRSGIAAGGAKPGFLARRIRSELASHGRHRYADLLRRAEQDEPGAFQALRNLLTIKYSRFWREPAHWPILGEHLRLKFLADAPVRLWSAACARGEEAYSMAMVAAEVQASLPGLECDWRVLASDVDTDALASTASATYSRSSLGDLPARLRARYLVEQSGRSEPAWQVTEALRDRVDRLHFDLTRPEWPALPGAPFDVIFLSNALIYFDRTVQARVLGNAAACLRPDGILLTGRSEGRLTHAAPWLKACGDCAYIPAAAPPPPTSSPR